MNFLRRWRGDDELAGSLAPSYPEQQPARESVDQAVPTAAPPPDEADFVEPPPSLLQRIGESLGETRRRVLPLPDEVIPQFLGSGERMIHNDHPSFRSFVVENTLLFIGFLILGVVFLGITFNGSLIASAGLLLVLSVFLLVLVLRRLEDRYTSYVITDTRIMVIKGVISRRAHSIPWVRVTDLTIEQKFMGRLFGYATLHIESANEDSGLRNLLGVSDPMQFNQYVVDMVVAKQGSTAPKWEEEGGPAPAALGRGLRRLRLSRRRLSDGDLGTGDAGGAQGQADAGGGSARPGADRRVYVGGDDETRRGSVAGRPGDDASLDPETLASELRSSGDPDLPWHE